MERIQPLLGHCLFLLPVLAEGVDLGLAAAVAHGTDGLEVGADSAPLAFVAVHIGLEPLDKLLLVGLDERYRSLPLGIARLGHLGLLKVALGGVSGDTKPTGGFAHGDVVSQHHAS